MDKRLPLWFRNRLKTIMNYNNYGENEFDVANCTPKDVWTPVDLVLREWYNNGGGSSQGFLGITRKECERCYDFIKDNQELLKELGMYNKKGISNFGFTLWDNWEIH